MPLWLPPALLGFLLGLAVSGLNHLILRRGLQISANLPAEKGKNIIMFRYGLRLILDFLALFAVYKNVPMLIGTAFGLTAIKNGLFIKYLFKGK